MRQAVIVATLLAAACPGPPTETGTGPDTLTPGMNLASATATLGGQVVDVFTGAAVAGATVYVGASTLVTDAEGAFTTDAATGWVAVRVEAAGYRPYNQEHGVLSTSDALVIAVAPVPTPISWPATDVVLEGGVTLDAAAFPVGADVSADWLAGDRLAAATETLTFEDADGPHIGLGVLHLAATAGAGDGTIMIAIPAGVSAADLRLHSATPDGWGAGVPPLSIVNDTALFPLPENRARRGTDYDGSGIYTVGRRGAVVTAASGAVRYISEGGEEVIVRVGDYIPVGARVVTGSNSYVTFERVDKSRRTLGSDSESEALECTADDASAPSIVERLKGELRNYQHKSTPESANRVHSMQRKSASWGVRGTIFSVYDTPEGTVFEVTDGQIDLNVADGTIPITAGQIYLCPECLDTTRGGGDPEGLSCSGYCAGASIIDSFGNVEPCPESNMTCENLDGLPTCIIPDFDGDGWTVGEGDCDDFDASRYPRAPETCNGLDDDCDPATPDPCR